MARLYMTGIKDTVNFGFLCNKYFIIMQIFSLIALSSCSDASLDRSNNGKMDPVKFNISEFNQTNQNNEITTNNSTEGIQFLSTTLDQNTFTFMYAQNISTTDVNIGRNSTEYKQRIGFNESSTVSDNIRKKIEDVIASLWNLQERNQTFNNTQTKSIRSKKKKINIKKYKKTSKILNKKKNSRRRENRKLAKFYIKKIKNSSSSKKFDNNTSFSYISNVNNSLNFDNSSNSFDNSTVSLGKKKLNIYFNENKNQSSSPGFSEYYTVHSIVNKFKANLNINDRQKREENSDQVHSVDNTPEEMEFYDLDADYDLYSEQNVIKGIQNDETKTNSKSPLKKGGKRQKKQKNKNQLKQNSSKINNNNFATDSYSNHQDYSSKSDVMKREEIDENTALLYLMKSLLDNDIIDNVDEVLPNDVKNKNSSILQFINNNVQNDWVHPSKKEAGMHSTDKITYPFHFNIYFYNNQEDECSTESSDILSYPIIMPTRMPDLIHHQDDQGGSEKKGMYRESFMDYGRTSNSENSVSCPGGCNMGTVVLAILGVFIGTAVLAVLAYNFLWKFLKRKMCGETAMEVSEGEPSCE